MGRERTRKRKGVETSVPQNGMLSMNSKANGTPDVLTSDDGLGKSGRQPPPPFADWNDGMDKMKFDAMHVELLM